MEHFEGMRFPPKETKSRTYCCVDTCNSRASGDPTVRFHHFPPAESSFVDIINEFGKMVKMDRRRAWENALKMKKEVTASMRVCSLHFRRDNYILPDVPAISRYLKVNAVPSCNLPILRNAAKVRQNRVGCLKRQKQTRRQIVTPQNQTQIAIAQDVYTSDRIQCLSRLKTGTRAISVVTNLSYFCTTITGDGDLSALIGISNFSTLNNLVKMILKAAPRLENYCQLSVRHQVILTFLKLKHNVSYSVLAVIFKCIRNNCKKVVLQILDALSSFLKYAIPWPSKSEILQKWPPCYKDYKDVRVVVNCIQVFIQKPKNMSSQVNTYSQCKGPNTIKFMIGVTPDGVISFASKSFGGRVTNSVIFEESGLIDLLDKKDVIMVAKDFFIDDICGKTAVRIVRTPSTNNNKQISNDGRLFDAQCLNRNLKTFRVLGDRIPLDLANKSDQIFIIICAILNLNSGILSDVDYPS